MKVIACRDLGGFDCNAIMKGRNVDEAVDATIKHRVSMHGQNVRELQQEESRTSMSTFARELE